MLTMSSYSCFIFDPYLVSFPLYAIPICPPFRNPYDFYLLVSTHFLYMVMETIKKTCVQSFISICATVSKFDG